MTDGKGSGGMIDGMGKAERCTKMFISTRRDETGRDGWMDEERDGLSCLVLR